MIRRTGAKSVSLRFHDDEPPTVWLAIVVYDDRRWETDAGHSPLEAMMRLCERVIDGGLCAHCHKPTAFAAELEQEFEKDLLCWYVWDPELKTFRRGCE